MVSDILDILRALFWGVLFRQRHLLQFVRTYRGAKNLDFFDDSYYRSQFAKDLPNWVDSLAHCLSQNTTSFSSPHLLFDANYYLAQNPEILNSGINPLTHFVLEGVGNNQSPHPLIDSVFYARTHPDVLIDLNQSPLRHFFYYGFKEKRQTHALVNFKYYLAHNPDVAESGVNPLVHFLDEGAYQGRNPHRLFDCEYYLGFNPEVAQAGVNPLVHFLKLGIFEGRSPFDIYSEWIELHEKRGDINDVDRLLQQSKSKPLVSIIMPVFNTSVQWLKKAIDSVLIQTYPHWELCIADDGSTSTSVRPILEAYEKLDSRINVVYRSEPGHISAASNSALEVASGEFIGLLDHDDELHQNALLEVALTIDKNQGVDLIYSDEDKITPSGVRFDPFFKPDWAPERLLSQMYCGHLGIYRTSIVRKIGGFRQGYHGSQDYDLCLRFTERSQRICHIPKILYHWRALEKSTALNSESKSYAYEAGVSALQDALDRRGEGARVYPVSRRKYPGRYRVRYPLENEPRVSIIFVDTCGENKLDTLSDSMLEFAAKTNYDNLEFVISLSTEEYKKWAQNKKTLKSVEKLDFTVIASEQNQFSKSVNSAVSAATGAFIAIINPDLKICSSRWVQIMVSRLQQPGVSAVGPKILNHDKSLYSAGLILRRDAPPMHSHIAHPKRSMGYFGQLVVACNCSALSIDFLVTSRLLFKEVGRLDEELSSPYTETDFCLRLSEKGYRHVFEPDVIARFRSSRPVEKKISSDNQSLRIMQKRWASIMTNDPLYSPNLNQSSGGYRMSNFPKGVLPFSEE